ncbi:hypothetical protein F52700_3356 [Fusarium sp. NRRL 52700]|nr:hypothetical protein F52700_3356 [Fusarium sp. NRRL 52700]
MVKVTIAGGTGAVGKTLVDVLAGQTKHQGIILTHKEPTTQDLALPYAVVDYADVGSLTAILEEYQVHTVISAFIINGKSLSILAHKNITVTYLTCHQEALGATDLEWTVVHNGIFMDYYFPCTLKSHYYNHKTLVVDIPDHAAAIPGAGNEHLTLTSIHDSAQLLWRLLLAEYALGVAFDIKYDDLEKLTRFEVSDLPGHSKDFKRYPKEIVLPFLSIFERWTAEGLSEVKPEGSLNEMFPEIKPLTVKDLMDQHWKGFRG